MARYSRVRGPAVDFELVNALVLVPGFTIARQFGRGTLLICGHVVFGNGGIGAVGVGCRVLLDAVAVAGAVLQVQIQTGQISTIGFSYLEPVQTGFHTITLEGVGSAGAGDTVLAVNTELVVVELPAWDSDGDLVTL